MNLRDAESITDERSSGGTSTPAFNSSGISVSDRISALNQQQGASSPFTQSPNRTPFNRPERFAPEDLPEGATEGGDFLGAAAQKPLNERGGLPPAGWLQQNLGSPASLLQQSEMEPYRERLAGELLRN